jgi:hypothetical protein
MAKIEPKGVVRLKGLLGGLNAGAVSLWKKRLLVVADEMTDDGNAVQVFDADGGDFRAAKGGAIVLDAVGSEVEEMDLEGIAVDGNDVYVLGSHSSKRKKTDPEKKYTKNRTALMEPAAAEPTRDVLLRFRLDASGRAPTIERTSLRGFLSTTEPFRSFVATASKENGVDAEGLAFRDKSLYVGFRGPVLRGNFTPILRCRFGLPPTDHEILFVDLGGRGVRDLAQVDDGILILAGPVGDGPGSYQLYLWDGRDMVPGTGAPTSAKDTGLRLLGDLPDPTPDDGSHAKAEGLAIMEEKDKSWEILVVYDGLKNGNATRFKVDKR